MRIRKYDFFAQYKDTLGLVTENVSSKVLQTSQNRKALLIAAFVCVCVYVCYKNPLYFSEIRERPAVTRRNGITK